MLPRNAMHSTTKGKAKRNVPRVYVVALLNVYAILVFTVLLPWVSGSEPTRMRTQKGAKFLGRYARANQISAFALVRETRAAERDALATAPVSTRLLGEHELC